MNASDAVTLDRVLERYNVPTKAAAALSRYTDELLRWNETHKLISLTDAADAGRVIERHIGDSLRPWREIAEDLHAASLAADGRGGTARLYDLGSGAGLPGIPLALAISASASDNRPPVVLVERKARRVRFLEAVLPFLNIDGEAVPISVEQRDAFSSPVRASLEPTVLVMRAFVPAENQLYARLARAYGPGTIIHRFDSDGRIERVVLSLNRDD